jgi:hypothetical protein
LNIHVRRLLFLLCFSFLAVPALADEPGPTDATPVAAMIGPTGTGVTLSSRKPKSEKFSLTQWKLEHAEIEEIKASRYHPTERGMWYSTRSREEKEGRFISDAEFPLIFGEMAYLAASGKEGREAALDGAKSMVVTGALTMSIKKVFRRRRPYPNDNKFGTFPSGHTSSTFSMAGILGAAQPSLRVPAFLAASTVGWARVKVRAHHWQDVVAGSALGLTVSNQFKPDKKVHGPLARLSFSF